MLPSSKIIPEAYPRPLVRIQSQQLYNACFSRSQVLSVSQRAVSTPSLLYFEVLYFRWKEARQPAPCMHVHRRYKRRAVVCFMLSCRASPEPSCLLLQVVELLNSNRLVPFPISEPY